MQAHTYQELAIGLGLGALPQLGLWWFWL